MRFIRPGRLCRVSLPVALNLQLRSCLDAPAEARRHLDRMAAEIPFDLMADLRLLVSELVSNSVRHARLGPDARVGLRVAASALIVRVEVSDGGPGFLPSLQLPGPNHTSGRGLVLVDRIADRWGVLSGLETRVWFEIDREHPAAR